jgi:cell division protease FtsH
VINEAYGRAKDVLTEAMDLLHSVAAALLERETLTGEEINILARGEQLPPMRSGTPTPPTSTSPSPAAASEPRRVPPILGGPEVAPA